MRGVAIIAVTGMALGLATPSQAQKKQKDPVLQQYLFDEFSQLNAKLERLAERVSALETEMGKLKQQQNDALTEVRNAQNVLKATDTSLSSFRLSSQQDLFSLKTDLAAVRQDLARVTELINKGPSSGSTAQPAGEGQANEGYITVVGNKEVTINLGSAAGIRVGSEFNVYKSNEPRTQVGIIEVVEVIDANNSRARTVYVRPGVRLEFSDIVRPR